MFIVILFGLFAVFRTTFMLMLCKCCLHYLALFKVNIFDTTDLNMAHP